MSTPDWVPLYWFDDGAMICRATSSSAAVKHAGYHPNDWNQMLSGTKVLLGLFLSSVDPEITLRHELSSTLGVIGSKAPTQDPWNQVSFDRIVRINSNNLVINHLQYWWTFAVDMLFPIGRVPQGRWHHAFKVPIVYDQRLHERLEQSAEKTEYEEVMDKIRGLYDAQERGQRMNLSELKQLRDNARTKAYRFARTAFDGIYENFQMTEARHHGEEEDQIQKSLIVQMPRIKMPIHIKWIGERGHGEDWAIEKEEGEIWRGKGALGHELLELWRSLKFKHFGPMLTQTEADDWKIAPGEPVVDVGLFLALEAVTPVLWPHEEFLTWYLMMRGEDAP